MNTQQNQFFQFPNNMTSFQNQLQVENGILKTELLKINEQYKQAIQSNKELKQQNEDLTNQISILYQQLNQKDNDSNNLRQLFNFIIVYQMDFYECNRKTLEDQKIFEEKQSDLKHSIIMLQQTNQSLMKQLDQFKQNKQIFEIQCKPYVSQNRKEEMVHLKWDQQIDNLQLQYKWNKKVVELKGYGEIKDNFFIFFQQCELSSIPLAEKKPQIIQKQNELFIIIQV